MKWKENMLLLYKKKKQTNLFSGIECQKTSPIQLHTNVWRGSIHVLYTCLPRYTNTQNTKVETDKWWLIWISIKFQFTVLNTDGGGGVW